MDNLSILSIIWLILLKKSVIMQLVSATEAKQSFAAVIDKAQREPVVIRKQNRDVAVIMSIEDYNRITRTNIRNFNNLGQILDVKLKKMD